MTLPHSTEPRIDPPRRYTLDDHPNRNVEPDEWMLRRTRQTVANLMPLYAAIELPSTRKDQAYHG